MTLTFSEARIQMKAIHMMVIAAFLASAACNKPKEEAPAADSHGGMTMDSGRMEGMSGMGSSGMMRMMQAHTDSMTRMNPGQMSGMMPSHERMMSKMMDQMGTDMRQMKMAETPEWGALSDSVKQDLAELPGLRGQQLSSRMRAHADRVRRLITSHEQMMKGM